MKNAVGPLHQTQCYLIIRTKIFPEGAVLNMPLPSQACHIFFSSYEAFLIAFICFTLGCSPVLPCLHGPETQLALLIKINTGKSRRTSQKEGSCSKDCT